MYACVYTETEGITWKMGSQKKQLNKITESIFEWNGISTRGGRREEGRGFIPYLFIDLAWPFRVGSVEEYKRDLTTPGSNLRWNMYQELKL